jgi:hypothetical protein
MVLVSGTFLFFFMLRANFPVPSVYHFWKYNKMFYFWTIVFYNAGQPDAYDSPYGIYTHLALIPHDRQNSA